jgi:hypothetical protein
MVMRYHWGLAIGHLYTHERAADKGDLDISECSATERPLNGEATQHTIAASSNEIDVAEINQSIHSVADEELGLSNRDDDDWLDVGISDDESERTEESDDALAAMDEMYGSLYI